MSRKKSTEVSREEAIAQLWRLGILDFKLTDVQKIMKNGILDDFNKISVVLASRRLGKSYLMCTMALEKCLQTAGAVVKYIFPKQKDAKRNIVPIMRMILEDCPADVKPDYMEADKCFRFKNGSEIQFAGSDNGNAESIRGGFAHLCIFDEVGFATDTTYIIRSILSPTIKTTKGRVILVSTPPRSANHEFQTDYIEPYQAEDRIKVFTIYDNPNFTPEIIQETISEYPLGIEDPDFQREYLCKVTRNVDKCILPSLTEDVEKVIVSDKYVRPHYFDSYVSMDIGGKDLTAVLFAYYDYLNATVVFEDEIVVDGTVNTEILAKLIAKKERELWTNPIDQSVQTPYMRVADNNNIILLTDLQKLHNLTFIPTRKDNREAAINALDVALSQKKIIIHPRCKHLLYHMKFAEWNNNHTTFKKLKDSPTGQIKGGHADCLASAIYLYRNVIKSKNPYPSNYDMLQGSNVFTSQVKKTSVGDLKNTIKDMLGIK